MVRTQTSEKPDIVRWSYIESDSVFNKIILSHLDSFFDDFILSFCVKYDISVRP